MAQLSDEFGLYGFVLPGKPGIICVEGDLDNCHNFYRKVNYSNRDRYPLLRGLIPSKHCLIVTLE